MMDGATVRLWDLCDLVSEPVKPGERPDALYLGLEHLAPGRLVHIGGGRASDMRSNTSAFQPGDVLYGKLRPYLDKAILADQAGVCTTELLVLRAKMDVNPRFLAAALHSPSFLEHAVAGTTGVQHPRTSWAHIREFESPAFTLEEQHQVAGLLWLVHKTIAQSEALVEEGQALKRTAMQTLFTRGLRGEAQKETEIGLVPESWEIRLIGEFAQQMQYGLSLRGMESGRYPILRMNCQQDGKVLFRDLQFVDVDSEIAETYRVNQNDLLFNRTNSYELVGRTAIVEEPTDAVFASYLVRVSVDEERLSPRFLNHFLNWDTAQWELKKLASRGVSQANISAGKLRNFSILVPSTDEQGKVVAILDAIDRKIDLHRRKRVVLEELFKALLHKLMMGEIRVGELDLSAVSGNANYGMQPEPIGDQG